MTSHRDRFPAAAGVGVAMEERAAAAGVASVADRALGVTSQDLLLLAGRGVASAWSQLETEAQRGAEQSRAEQSRAE